MSVTSSKYAHKNDPTSHPPRPMQMLSHTSRLRPAVERAARPAHTVANAANSTEAAFVITLTAGSSSPTTMNPAEKTTATTAAVTTTQVVFPIERC
ncbi:hypothetical protein [Mycolicibacterium hodleri]|uniref:hypothetical protein n=1 Tax=Mycolicibacterium hodleri TaxID=49897 RepID=UPI00163BA000|nr:hypothetical protein [Mycolicibacterium hodleri]